MERPEVVVNGRRVPLDGVASWTTALDWLRGTGLTGVKEGCAEGECGACSVLVARPGTTTPTRWTALNACLVPAAALDGQEVVTAEGLRRGGDLHPVQHEMAVRGGSQCGFCTPGFVCSMAAEYYRPGREPGPGGFDEHALSGNLCRCTGYRPIRDAAEALGAPAEGDDLAARCAQPPPAPRRTRVSGGGTSYVRPGDLAEALALLAEHPDAVVVAGGTDWGVEVGLRGARPPLVVGVDRLEELRGCVVGDAAAAAGAVEVGAALSLSEVEERVRGQLPLLEEVLPQFASRLIRNGATVGGNLATGSPIGDLAPALLALEADVVLVSTAGERVAPLASFWHGYRRTDLRPGELVRSVRVPLPLAPLVRFTKVAKRRFDDISSVAVALAVDVELDDRGAVVEGAGVRRARIGLGGVAATPVRARAAEAALEGSPWTDEVVRRAADVLGGEGTPLDDHRASAAYRSAMLRQSLLKVLAEHPPARALEGAAS